MHNRLSLLLCSLALALAGCTEQEPAREHGAPSYDDAAFLLDGLAKEVSEAYVPIRGFLTDDGLVIPVASVFEAEEHFRSLLPPGFSPRDEGNTLVWSMTDGQGAAQGDAVFRVGDGSCLARIDLPDTFPQAIGSVVYRSSAGLLTAVNPAVQEDLEDNYYYGAIVDIADHGCGSGKFVVLREYDFAGGAAGLAVRLDGKRYSISQLGNYEFQIAARSSCLATMRTAGEIIRKDWSILTKQLKYAGSRQPDQHFYSNDRHWTGTHYYYCLHDGECDTIGPFHDLEFYECWLYWFVPEGDHIRFW